MVGIKLLLLSSLFFFQGIRGYCIHNRFSDGSTFRITQHPGIKEEPSQSYFTRHMKKDTTECCPYTSKFCSPSLSDGNGAKLGFKIFFIDRSSYVGTVSCTTGGELTFLGTKEKYYAECTNAKGVTFAAQIFDFKQAEA